MENNVSAVKQNKPWYSFPLVWMLILIPLSAVVMGAIMIWLAVNSSDGLVTDDYYKRGLEINRVIGRDKKATELKLGAVIQFERGSGVIHLQFDKGLMDAYPQTLHLYLQHATRENSDIEVVLNHGIGNKYIGYVKQVLNKGVWYFILESEEWKLSARTHVDKNNTIELHSSQYE